MRLKRAAHHHIEEVFTPFRSRLDKAMGLAPTRQYVLPIWLCWYNCLPQ
jgi:hypothetical protein